MVESRTQQHYNKRRRLVRRVYPVILFVSFLPLSAQNNASDLLAEIEVYHQTEPIIVGQNFSVFVEIPVEYASGLRFGQIPNPLSDQEQSVRYWAGPGQVAAQRAGTIRYQFLYRANRAGWTELGPFSIILQESAVIGAVQNRVGQSITVQSESLLIPITSDGNFIPPLLEWRIPQQTLYPNQSMYISLDMYRASQIVFPNEISIGRVDNGILQEVTGLGELSIHEFAGREFTRVPIATFLYTPLIVGNLSIPNASARFSTASTENNSTEAGIVREGESQTVTVIPLPVAVESSAIGNFSIRVSDLKESYTTNEVINFELQIHGRGNLHILQFPNIRIEGGVIESMEEIDNFTAVESGYSGTAIERYQIRATNSPELIISIDEFQWFNPQTQSIEEIESSIMSITIIPEEIPQQSSFAELVSTINSRLNPIILSRGILGSILFVLPPIILVLYLSIARKWKKVSKFGVIAIGIFCVILSLITPRSENEGSGQGDHITNTLQIADRYNFDLQISSAQLEYDEGNLPQAMAYIRRALSIAPFHSELRELVVLLENEMNLFEQHYIPQFPHGDWLYLVILISIVIFSLVLVVNNFSLKMRAMFGACMLLVVVIISLSLSILYFYEINNQEAIIPSGGTILKKIPDPNASDWIYLPEGTSVQQGARTQRFVQIRTANGIVAWVAKSNIFSLESKEPSEASE